MLQTTVISIEFDYNGVRQIRNIDKIIFIFKYYQYTVYRIPGKECNFDLIKHGKWWQVDTVKRLPYSLLEIIGSAIDKAEGNYTISA